MTCLQIVSNEIQCNCVITSVKLILYIKHRERKNLETADEINAICGYVLPEDKNRVCGEVSVVESLQQT